MAALFLERLIEADASDSMSSNLRKRLQQALSLFGLMALVLLAFWPALTGGFIFDDYPVVVDNPVLHVTGWHWHDWQAIWSWSQANIQRPMAMLTYALNYALGNGAFGFKLTNLGIHLLNTALTLFLVERILSAIWSDSAAGAERSRTMRWWALGITAAWAVHPLQVSTVMYVVQRMEMLSFTFVLASLLSYWRGRQQQLSGGLAWPWIALSIMLAAIGLCFKETALLTAGYALLIELTIFRFGASTRPVGIAWKTLYIAGCVLSALIAAIYVVPHYSNPAFYVGRDFNAWQRELSQLRILPMYMGWVLLPIPSHLLFYYDNYVSSVDLLHPFTTALGGGLLLGLLVLSVVIRKKRPLFSFGIWWFFVAHALTSSPVPLELVFEHRNYPALLGLILAAADIIHALSERSRSKIFAAIACALVLNLAFLTVLRAATWGDSLRLSMALTETNPGSVRASLDLARRLMAMSQGNPNTPLYSMSIKELERATKLPGASPLAEEALLLEASKHAGMPSDAWWESIRNKLENYPLIPDTFVALHKLTISRLVGNTGLDAQQLASCYAIAVKRNPRRESLRVEYAELAGIALNDPTLASEQWRAALQLDSDLADYARSLAQYLVEAQRNQEAQAVIRYAMELRPSLQSDPVLTNLLGKLNMSPAATPSDAHQSHPLRKGPGS